MGRFHGILFAVAMLGGAACTEEEPELTDDWADNASCEDGGKCDGEGAVPRISSPELMINDVEVLGQLEANGHKLSHALGGDSATNAALHGSSTRFQALVQTLEADLAEFKSKDREAGVGLAYSHRQFDAKWLRSPKAKFRLSAVINRTDLVHTTPGACGEVRFIYRLMYETAQGSSRLPMTINVVHDQHAIGGSCAGVARAWKDARGQYAAVHSMLAGYQSPARIEINLQAVRWPAVTRADMGGYAEYLMRIFNVAGTTLTPALLPNTIKSDLNATQKSALAAWISSNAAAVDRGTALVPDEYLAYRAISVSPRGLARGANRPFLSAFPNPEQTFAQVSYSGLSLVKSPAGLLRKLDTMSCQGCHQSRGLAGFHILGEEAPSTFRANAIEVGSSPHLNDELAWRRSALDDVAAGRTISAPRPFAERTPTTVGKYGAHCGLAGDPSFASWTCASGYQCKDLSGEEIGMCVTASAPGAGDACETSNVSFDPNPLKDKVSDFEVQTCGVMPTGRRAYCNRSGTKPFTTSSFGGFPNGSCSSPCLTMGKFTGDAICGAQPPNGFNDCLGAGKPFTTCLADATPELRRRCDAATPCGDDYVCAGVPGAPKGVGACMPPYFIFQVRVDGHSVR
jgi:hypothetical protein